MKNNLEQKQRTVTLAVLQRISVAATKMTSRIFVSHRIRPMHSDQCCLHPTYFVQNEKGWVICIPLKKKITQPKPMLVRTCERREKPAQVFHKAKSKNTVALTDDSVSRASNQSVQPSAVQQARKNKREQSIVHIYYKTKGEELHSCITQEKMKGNQ